MSDVVQDTLGSECVPRADASERGLLAAVLLDGSRAPDVFALVSPQDFYNRTHRAIFTTIEFYNPVREIWREVPVTRNKIFRWAHRVRQTKQDLGPCATRSTSQTTQLRERFPHLLRVKFP